MKKKVDERVRTLIETGVKSRHRSIFVIVGDKGRNLVVFLHQMLSRAVIKANPSVLWCYKKELFLSSHKKKRMKQVKKMMQRGLMDSIKEDPFSVFVASTEIRYCYYAETEKILGNTFGMCVLQDFEALTPNLLARTIETVEGGGIVLLLLSSLSSLSSLYAMTMDVHSRFRTEAHGDVTGRFNERFILSLASCKSCVVMDDEFNILPISSHLGSIVAASPKEEEELTEAEKDLKELKSSLRETQPIGPLVGKCRTLDQAKAVITFLDAISEKTLRSTVALTAARGRGKSAALGVAIAGAIALGYSNIFVTAPSPENLKTLFQFVLKGFDSLEYKEHLDYDTVESTNPDFNKAIVRVNIYRQHRQTIQYIQPQEHEKLAQAELVVIDEAAAIPLPIVKALLGPYLVFLCSTVNGYEGTGRSLSLKLIHQLREQGQKHSAENGAVSGRTFREVELSEPIRYSAGDSVEAWLNELLCLNAANHIPKLEGRLPHPSECRLYYVNRDTLFSFHKASEVFLQRMMALYVASHYKNTPNDLQLMSDAPAHHLFVLLGPVDESQNTMPDIFCVAQVCLEGKISKESALRSLSEGTAPSGDQIPWKVSEQFQDSEFPSLSGARIVRIAVHPSLVRAGYGSATVDLLARYYEGQLTDLTDLGEVDYEPATKKERERIVEAAEKVALLEEVIKPRTDLPPLLVGLNERAPEKIHYLGVSFGLTLPLYNFWHRHNFWPLYIGQIPNATTGEHSCIVVRALENEEVDLTASGPMKWVQLFNYDFRRRFMNLLGSCFKHFSPALALSVLDPKISYSDQEAQEGATLQGIFEGSSPMLTPYDMKRLESYSNNLVDYHLILDLVPTISRFYFLETLPTTLSYGQAAILLCLGLQHQSINHTEAQLNLPRNQVLALFNKSIRKLHNQLHRAAAKKVEAAMPRLKEVTMNAHLLSVEEDLDDAARQVKADMKRKLEEMLNPEDLQKYAISADADNELSKVGKFPKSGFVSVKSAAGNSTVAAKRDKTTPDAKSQKRKGKKENGKSHSKRSRT